MIKYCTQISVVIHHFQMGMHRVKFRIIQYFTLWKKTHTILVFAAFVIKFQKSHGIANEIQGRFLKDIL